jgi:hypothetical protein
MSLSLDNIILLVILFNFSEPLFLKLSLYLFHFLFFPLFLFQLLLPFLFLFFFLLPLSDQILLVSHVSLFDKTHQILDGLDVVLSLLCSFFSVFLLHSALDPSVLSLTGVIALTPCECLVCGEVLPVFVKLDYFLCCCGGSTESLEFSHLLFQIISRFKCLHFFALDLFEYVSINRVKSSLVVSESLKTSDTEEFPNIKAKRVLLQIFFGHLIFIEQYLFSIIIVKSSFVWI